MIRYDENRKRVTQIIGRINICKLEGDFEEVILYLKKEHNDCIVNFIEAGKEITEKRGWSGDGNYLDGATRKTIQFDKIYLYAIVNEDERELQIIGERDFLPEELDALTNKINAQEQKERQELERLKKKYPNY